MSTIEEYLLPYYKPTPDWLERPFDRNAFFSRTVYYPGSGRLEDGIDDQPVRVCNLARATHAYIYVDYGVRMEEMYEELRRRPGRCFQGYTVLGKVQELEPCDLFPNFTSWPTCLLDDRARENAKIHEPYFSYAVFERDKNQDRSHGASRFAVLFVGADGFATYDALYCQGDTTSPPFLALIQDHGWGCNYDEFGAGGLLEKIAYGTCTFPKFLLVGDNTEPWHGYHDTGAEPDPGGKYDHLRRLFRRDNDESGLDIT